MKIVLLLLLTFSINTAIACSCDKSTILENFKGSDVVIKGKVIDIKEVNTKGKATSGQLVDYKRYEFKFKIKNRYKGLKSKEPVTITTTGGDSDCGNYFDLGKSYIVYAYKEDLMLSFSLIDKKTDEYLSTNLCTKTKQAYPWTFLESLVLDIL